MRHAPPPTVRAALLLLLVALGGYWFFFQRDAEAGDHLTASGTIEARQVSISGESGGRVREVLVEAGEAVTAGQPLVRFDTALLEAQLAQARAGVAAAQASHDLLVAGASPAQLAAAQATVGRAQASLDSLDEQLTETEEQAEAATTEVETLNRQIAETTSALNAARDQLDGLPADAPAEQRAALQTAARQAEEALVGLNGRLLLVRQAQSASQAQARLLASQITVAEASLDSAVAQLAALQEGARPEQLRAAEAQVAAAAAALALVETQIGRQTLGAPIDGVVLLRAVEPGEVAAPGAPLLVLGELDALTITVFVPEDRYGRLTLGQPAIITVDSFPGESFSGTIRRIADQAEFTPRNVQTAEGRASTVFAVELAVTGGNGRLKPGMPADVDFGGGQ